MKPPLPRARERMGEVGAPCNGAPGGTAPSLPSPTLRAGEEA
jgi:hypothetical protein